MTYPQGANASLYIGFTEAKGGLNGFAGLKLVDYFTVANTNGIDISNYGVAQDVSSGWTVSEQIDFTESDTFLGTDGKTYNKVPGLAIAIADNGKQKLYDSHYLVGNYYQWLAATAQELGANNKNPNDYVSVDGSICPSNWRLPYSGGVDTKLPISHNYNATSGSYYYLLEKYGGNAFTSGNADTNLGYALFFWGDYRYYDS